VTAPQSPLAALGRRTLVMGVLNVTPDSFADGGEYLRADAAVARAATMVAEGADIIDVGGESTRPGAAPVSETAELERVMPVLEALRARFATPLSIDTSKPAVMRAAVAAGAAMINDIYALRRPGALATAAELGVPVCLMHMQGEPATMQRDPQYADVVGEVRAFLAERVDASMAAGVKRQSLVVDPGFGFGKSLAHNLELLRALRRIAPAGVPLMVGLSRKSIVGAITGKPVNERVHASVALAVYAALNGADIVRVHDVGATVDALRMISAVVKGAHA
jgi:dihydropteroate synthase